MPWNLNISTISFATTPIAHQVVEILFRQAGTTGAFTSAGNAVFDTTGAIVGMPNPFVITNIPDDWNGVEIKTTNTCNNSEFVKTFGNPNASNCIAVGISGTPNLSAATVGEPYSYSFALTGDGPFALFDTNKPAWLDIVISGNSVEFSGTPTTSGTVNVSFDVTNCDGVNSVSFSDTITIEEAEEQPGNITLDCNIATQDGIPFGVAGSYTFYGMGITVITPGTVTITAHNDQAGSLSGFSMYKQQTITVAPGQTSIDFQVDYDGAGVHTIFEMTFSVTDTSGTQNCTGSFFSFD